MLLLLWTPCAGLCRFSAGRRVLGCACFGARGKGCNAGDQVIALVLHLEANDKKARAMAAEAQHWAYK
jgi:hypothetical protein